ncbi:MAG: acylphosphatase [Candidatus Liptonbacteria bacterium]|nr:acylphosphatase [Candidatus Liptonbacteria bacterium]
MEKHLTVKIYGFVQGMFFRFGAKVEAEKRGIKGFARNEDDGSVYIEAEGNEKDLSQFLEWCRKGPALAKVEKVDFEFKNELKGFKSFDVK